MKIEFEGRTWSWDETEITVDQAMVIERETGLTIDVWEQALSKSVKAVNVRALYWAMAAQNGEQIDFAQANFRILPFIEAFAEGIRAEAQALKAAEEPDPTVTPATPPIPAGQLPAGLRPPEDLTG